MVTILNLQTAKMGKIWVFFRKINIFPAILNFHVIYVHSFISRFIVWRKLHTREYKSQTRTQIGHQE
jgi:hypothetical protein